MEILDHAEHPFHVINRQIGVFNILAKVGMLNLDLILQILIDLFNISKPI